MGGRGGASGMGGKAATGGKSGYISITNYLTFETRMMKVTSFSGNDGMVQELAFGTIESVAPKQSRLDANRYDFFITPFDMYYNGDIHSPLAIGVKMAPLQAVSEKQHNYARNVLMGQLTSDFESGFPDALHGDTTVNNVIQKVKKFPKMNARELLDRRFDLYRFGQQYERDLRADAQRRKK